MKKIVFCFVIVLSLGFAGQKQSCAACFPFDVFVSNIVCVESGEDVYGYTYIGCLDYKASTETRIYSTAWGYIWKKDGVYYITGDRHPYPSTKFRRIYRDNNGYYFIYDESWSDGAKEYLCRPTPDGWPLVKDIEREANPRV